MSEGIPNGREKESARNERIIALARELSERQEAFPFPGIDPDAYIKLKAAEVEAQEKAHGRTATIDEQIKRCTQEGMKVVLGKDPESGMVYILPAQSNDIVMDSISPKHLEISTVNDGRLKELILLIRSREK